MKALREASGQSWPPTCRRADVSAGVGSHADTSSPKTNFRKTNQPPVAAGRTHGSPEGGGWGGAVGGLGPPAWGRGGGGGEKDVMEAGNLLRVPGPHQHPNSPSRRHRCRHNGPTCRRRRHFRRHSLFADMSARRHPPPTLPRAVIPNLNQRMAELNDDSKIECQSFTAVAETFDSMLLYGV